MKLRDELIEIFRVSSPWVAITTPDYRSTIKTVLEVAAQVNKVEMVPAVCYDVVNSSVTPVRGPNNAILSEVVEADVGNEDYPPHKCLQMAAKSMPKNSVFFFVVTDSCQFDTTREGREFLTQAIADCREPFKGRPCLLVILGPVVKLPALLSEDIPLLEDPLPDKDELVELIEKAAENGEAKVAAVDREKAAVACLGMTRFAAEEAVCRKLRKSGINLQGLGEVRQKVIEDSTDRALVFEKERWTFDQIGGLDAFKGFMSAIFGGPKRPSLVVRVDEIDKSINASSTGAVGDNTGVSQDILKTLLTNVEDNGWMGLLACGGPGTGKTLASICTGNQFETRTLAMDLGAVKGSLVGESEGKIRRVMQVIKSIGGGNVLFMATCNRLDTIPPELQRRFWLGTWFWDLPSPQERQAIWKIQRERFKIDPKHLPPDDTQWTGSDIRNCCQMAWACSCSLREAADRITISGVVSKAQIEALQILAERAGFRSAAKPGPYKRPSPEQRRKMNLN